MLATLTYFGGNMKVLDVRWFSGQSCVGIVRCDVPYEGIKYYIGPAMGGVEEIDKEHIAAWGARFPSDIGDTLFGIEKRTLDELYDGDAVVLPRSKEHAEDMLRVATFYLETQVNEKDTK